MFWFFKKKKDKLNNQSADRKDSGMTETGVANSIKDSVNYSIQNAASKFEKPLNYDRSLLDSDSAKASTKIKAFESGAKLVDPYTGDELVLTKAEAKLRYGESWTKHLAESDHIIPLKERYEQTKGNPWLTNEDIRQSSNSTDNLEVVSRKYNNAKRSKSNTELVQDDEYLDRTGLNLSEKGKGKAIKNETNAQKAMKQRDFQLSTKNIIKTGHDAGSHAAIHSGGTILTISAIKNMGALIKGEITAEDAIAQTVTESGKAAVTGYFVGGGLTTVSHALSHSSSDFLRMLSSMNVPANVVTGVILTGEILKKYGNGEITTRECMLQLGDRGLSYATTGYSMAIGQAMIPVPIVGAAIGAMVGATLASNLYGQLMDSLRIKELEHQERLRIMAECERAKKEVREFREDLEFYLESYFYEYKTCFDSALAQIYHSFDEGDADGIISGANQITKKLGGVVQYNNMDEFEEFLSSDESFIL